MKLHSVTYSEFDDQTFAWTLNELELIGVNLMVGKNATGKSRVLRLLDGLAHLIDGSRPSTGLTTGRYRAVFVDEHFTGSVDGSEMVYLVAIREQKVILEKLVVNGVTKLDRVAEGKTEITFEKAKAVIPVHIPEINLAASARRDPEQHPFFEPLHEWANSVKFFEFAKIEVMAYTVFEGKIDFKAAQSMPLNLHMVVKFGKERFGTTFVRAVVSDMRRIGFPITDFGLMSNKGMTLPIAMAGAPQALYVSEEGVDKKLPQVEVSNGMLRALGTLIFLRFMQLQKKRSLVLIDDIGEGLDFERSTKLIELIVEEAEKGFIQLVLTTNDRYVMNGVPLKYWTIIQRDKGQVFVFNDRNSSDVFAEFEEYGFNNFDFFSKELYAKGTSTIKL